MADVTIEVTPGGEQQGPPSRREARRRARKDAGSWSPRWYWPSLAAPSTIWLLIFFLLPLYVVVSVAFGTSGPIFGEALPVYEPWYWSASSFKQVIGRFFGDAAFWQPSLIRTFLYVAVASLICVVVGFLVAYYVARYGGKHKTVYLILLVAPFWISYLMRIFAWQSLLTTEGWVNDVLIALHLVAQPVDWLSGKPVTVILSLVYGYIPYMILPIYGGIDRMNLSLLEASRDLGAGPLRTFLRVTIPVSKQAILAGLVIVSLPMFGDYYTNDLMGIATNLDVRQPDQQDGHPVEPGPTRGIVGPHLDRDPARPDGVLPAVHTASSGGVGVSEIAVEPQDTGAAGPSGDRSGNWLTSPWRRPVFLMGFTWAYIAWALVPVLIAIAFSFNAGRSRSIWQGFSFRWWWQDPNDALFTDPTLRQAIVQSLKLSLLTMLIAVPLGTLFAIAIDRWHTRPAKFANFGMLFSFVVPEIILGVALWLLFTNLLRSFVNLGTTAQLLGLITFQLSYPVIIVRARLLTIGPYYEEAAMDLGATPRKAITRVLLPLLYPAIFASFAIVFADTIDDFVTVYYLSSTVATQPLSVKIYSAARSSPTPAVNAAATFMLLSTFTAIALALIVYRVLSRGQRKDGASSVQDFVSF